MKTQLQKVALIATLAFIGIGFAGTQQAMAADCPTEECNFGEGVIQPCVVPQGIPDFRTPVVVPSSGVIAFEEDLECHDCDGDCYEDGRYWAVVKSFSCHAANDAGDLLQVPYFNPDTEEMEQIPLVVGTQTETFIAIGPCEMNNFPNNPIIGA